LELDAIHGHGEPPPDWIPAQDAPRGASPGEAG